MTAHRCVYAPTSCDNRGCPHWEPHPWTWHCDQGSKRCGVCEPVRYVTVVTRGRVVRIGKVDGIAADGGWDQ